MLKKGYVYIGIGGGITGDIQINDTDIHAPLKKKYRELEQELMICQLRADPKKIPQPSRDDMMKMLVESVQSIDVDIPARYKALWLTSALDGSEDYLVSERIMSLVGEELKAFRTELMQTASVKQLKDLLKLITPPKGVSRRNQALQSDSTNAPIDEGEELIDCEGDEMQVNGQNQEFDDISDDEPGGDEPPVPPTQHRIAEQPSCSQNTFVELAPLCINEELRKDAKFVDELSLLLQKGETSTRFLSQLISIKKQYIAARRGIKKRIEAEHNESSNLDVSSNEIEAEASEVDDELSFERNAFVLFD